MKQRRTLPETGNYTIRIYANSVNPTYIGAYSFRTWCEVVACPDQLATLPNTALFVPLNKFSATTVSKSATCRRLNDQLRQRAGRHTRTHADQHAHLYAAGGIQRRGQLHVSSTRDVW